MNRTYTTMTTGRLLRALDASNALQSLGSQRVIAAAALSVALWTPTVHSQPAANLGGKPAGPPARSLTNQPANQPATQTRTIRNEPAQQPSAQPQPTTPGTKPTPASGSGQATGVTQGKVGERFKFPSIGLGMDLPTGVVWQGNAVGTSDMTYQIKPDEEVPVWVITAKLHESKRPEITLKEVSDSIIDALEDSVGTFRETAGQRARESTEAKVLSRQAGMRFGGKPAEQFFVSLPEGVDRRTKFVRGVTVVHLAPGKFLTMDLRVVESNLGVAKPAYQDILATAAFADPEALAAARGVSVKAGEALIGKLTPKDFASIANGQPIFLRCYKPAATGADSDATEIGYHQMTVSKGKRGQINPEGSPTKYRTADNEMGYLVRIKSRVLNPEPERQPSEWTRLDSEGYFWVSEDRKSEAWSLSMTQREGSSMRQPPLWTENGARDGDRMTISLLGPGRSDSKEHRIPTEGYLSLAEVYMLPQMIVSGGAAVDFAFYAYRSKNEAIMLRSDAAVKPTDKPGVWQITTRVTEDDAPMTTVYNDRGGLIRRIMADGTIWEPVEPKWLLDLWQRKGYPTK